ncbi:alpha/beta fold hydrolase [Flexithrix dorotheae]|uniref:alpha/beta fold hydrolase n=1 Tax=Flexithrix dorotheae TaxID=70993 RepID=UPI00037E8924|nr:alpha/beta hydrolase [Flexithrix dorotheae]
MFYKDIEVGEIKAKFADHSSKFTIINQQEIHYKDQGDGDVILMIHGSPGSLFIWNKWAEILSKNYRIIRMDLPAFGITGPNRENDYSLNYYINFVKSFVDKLELKKFHLIGNSLGGQITYEFTDKFPGLVEKMVLISPTSFNHVYETSMFPAMKIIQSLVPKSGLNFITPKSWIRQSLKQIYSDQKLITPSMVDLNHSLLLREGNRKALLGNIIEQSTNKENKVSEITTPTLLLWGEKDKIIPVVNASNFKSMITNVRLITYKDVGHFPFDEVPEQSAKDVEEFLKF